MVEVEELRSELVREQRVSRALREVGTALGSTVDLDALLELILHHLAELVEADRATLYFLDEAHGELVSRIVVGQKVRSIRVKLGHGIAGMVAQTGQPVRVAQAHSDPRFEKQWDTLTGYHTCSLLAAPLKNHQGRIIGVIQALNKRGGGCFDARDEEMVTALTTQAAVAIDHSRLLFSLVEKNRQLLETKEQLERRLQDMVLLLDLERATARALTIDELVTASLRLVARACDARGSALLLTEDDERMSQYVLDSRSEGEPERRPLEPREGFLVAAMVQGGILEVNGAVADDRFSVAVEGNYPFPVESVLAQRLDGNGLPLGALAIYSKRGSRPFSEEDRSLLQLVSANVSTAVRLFRANEERARSERLSTIGRLLSQVIHDFKSPMAAISGFVQMMAKEPNEATRGGFAKEILRQLRQITSMQREVLEFSRGERNVLIRRVILSRFFDDLEAQLRAELPAGRVELVMDVDRKAVARFDEGRIQRALLNLTRNAVEAMGAAGGTLTVRARVLDGDVQIAVIDTGAGIPKEIEGRLFQSFVSAGKKGGTGLGLAIVKKIVEEHGGRVAVESSSRGATFTLILPQAGSLFPLPPSERPGRGDGQPPSAR